MPEKHEYIGSHIPYPVLYEPEAVSFDLTNKLLSSNVPPVVGAIVTPLDLRRTPKRLTPQEILNSVSTHLNTSLGRIDELPSTDEEKARLESIFSDINTALDDAGSYIRKTLYLSAPRAQVHSKQDIVDLINKTSQYRQDNKKSLEQHAGYCALVSVALAVFELQKQESHRLEAERRYIEDILIARPGESSRTLDPLFFAHSAGSSAESLNVVISGLDPQCRAKLSMRDKSKQSQITKFVRKPESSAEEALKDAIGIRLELENSRIEDGLVKVLAYLQQNLDATDLTVEDTNLLRTARLSEFRNRKTEDIPGGENIRVLSDTSPLSADSFRAVKITGKIKVPRADKPDEMMYRPIEIQLVEPENKNESGLSSHAVYEFKKLLTVMTRLFGGCHESWLIKHLKEVAREEGFKDNFVQNTIDGLEKTGFMMRLPKTPNKKIYAASDVYRRWLRVEGLIEDDNIRDQVMHKLQPDR